MDMPGNRGYWFDPDYDYSVYLLVYSVNDPSSFEEAIDYYKHIKRFQEGSQFIFVENKV